MLHERFLSQTGIKYLKYLEQKPEEQYNEREGGGRGKQTRAEDC